METNHHFVRCVSALLALCATLFLAGCQVKLVPDYDEEFSKETIATQKEVASFLQGQINPTSTTDLTYEGNKATYNKIRVDLNTLFVLASSVEGNEATVDQVNTLIASMNELQERHQRQGRLSAGYLEEKQPALMKMFVVIIRTQNAKKAAR